MGKTYSVDLRKKVMAYISSGGRKRDAARIFNIGEDTIYRWIRLQKKGDLSPKTRTSFSQKIDLSALQDYILKHPDHVLKEIAQALQVSHQTVWVWLKRLKITLKKRPPCTKNAMKNRDRNSDVCSNG